MRHWRALMGCGSAAVSIALLGCGVAESTALASAVPHSEDGLAPRDYYRELKPAESKCHPAVPVLTQAEVGGRAYHEIGSLSATCYPGAPAVCTRTLSESACEHQADAAILVEDGSSGSPPGASSQSQKWMSARAVRWE